MKEKFVSPEVTKVEFDPKDVITTSGCGYIDRYVDEGGSSCETTPIWVGSSTNNQIA